MNPEIKGPEAVSVQDLFTVQDSVRKMMEEVLLREMMLHIKFENMLGALAKTSMQPKIPDIRRPAYRVAEVLYA